jgi:CubicO group peptidase (beta-lactamase class C family)
MQKVLSLLFSLLAGLSPNVPLAEGQSRTRLAVEFDRATSTVLKAGQPGGVVLVARNGRVIYKKAFGMANMELGVPMRGEMIFNIASQTKQFTAVAVLQLVEQGKLSLQDEVTKFLPDYPTGWQKITVENLLTHTAGIPPSAPEAMARLQGEKRLITLNEIIDTFKSRPLGFAPVT